MQCASFGASQLTAFCWKSTADVLPDSVTILNAPLTTCMLSTPHVNILAFTWKPPKTCPGLLVHAAAFPAKIKLWRNDISHVCRRRRATCEIWKTSSLSWRPPCARRPSSSRSWPVPEERPRCGFCLIIVQMCPVTEDWHCPSKDSFCNMLADLHYCLSSRPDPHCIGCRPTTAASSQGMHQKLDLWPIFLVKSHLC